MNRWARRHLDALVDELDEGEELLAAGRMMIDAAVPSPVLPAHDRADRDEVDVRRLSNLSGMMAARQTRMERKVARGRGSSRRKTRTAQELGFPAPGPVLVLGVTNRRLVIWRPSAVLGRPAGIIADVGFKGIADVRLLRRFGFTRLGITLTSGASVILQNLWCRSLPAIAAGYEQATTKRRSSTPRKP